MDSKKEIWKDIPNYNGIYQASNFGNIKSLKYGKEKLLKPRINTRGYLIVTLYKNGVSNTRTIHQLICKSFLNYIPKGYELVINHIDRNKLNNRVDNLEVVTPRYNTNEYKTNPGVSKEKNGFYRPNITINGKQYRLGHVKSIEDATLIYNNALKNIDKFNGDLIEFKKLVNPFFNKKKLV